MHVKQCLVHRKLPLKVIVVVVVAFNTDMIPNLDKKQHPTVKSQL